MANKPVNTKDQYLQDSTFDFDWIFKALCGKQNNALIIKRLLRDRQPIRIKDDTTLIQGVGLADSASKCTTAGYVNGHEKWYRWCVRRAIHAAGTLPRPNVEITKTLCHIPIHLSIYPSIHLSIYPSIHLSI